MQQSWTTATQGGTIWDQIWFYTIKGVILKLQLTLNLWGIVHAFVQNDKNYVQWIHWVLRNRL